MTNTTEQGRRRRILRTAIPLIILAVATAVAAALIATSPKAPQRERIVSARLVEVQELQTQPSRIIVHAMGTVQPAREVDIKAQATGEVVWLNPDLVPGGTFRQGDTLLRIDPSDYELAIQRSEASVTLARANLATEMGNQLIAQREYELLGEEIQDEDRELVLRQPQLTSARAQLASAEASLAQATLAKQRTVITAPFNGIVRKVPVNLGSQVNAQSPLVTLFGTDQYWVNAAIPVDQLKWIDAPGDGNQTGSAARVYFDAAWGTGVYRTGSILRVAGELEEHGRMARVLVAVDDPLALERNPHAPPMLVGSYVRLEFEGRQFDEVVIVARESLRDGNVIWLMDDEDRLEIRRVEIAYRGPRHVYITGGVRAGERLVTTDLTAAVSGMPLRTCSAVRSPGIARETPADSIDTPGRTLR